MMNDESRPSKDPGDTTGNSKHRPDEPTEPPDQPKGTSARVREAWVETRGSSMSRDHTGRTTQSGHDTNTRGNTGEVEGSREVQGDGMGSGRGNGNGNGNGAASSTSSGS